MISRIWYGWTTQQNADAYEKLLKTEIFPGIVERKIAGFRRIELLRRPDDDEVEFVTIMWFDSLDAVKAFAGDSYQLAVVPPAARALLKGCEQTAAHFDVRETREA
jgi:antibiotic biosynthesis monooxygenase (ABM) superfamily enzyme